MKKIIITLLLIASFSFTHAQSATENTTKSSDYSSRLDTLTILKTSYWSLYGVNGSIAFFNIIGETAAAAQKGQELISLEQKISKNFNAPMDELKQFGNSYPVFIFGVNALAGGTAFIPVYGSLIYGSLCYTAGTAFAYINSINPLKMFYFSNYPGVYNDHYYKIIREEHISMFNPAPYFAVGTVSIISGIAEVILYNYYKREILRNKYPHFQRVITMIPGGVSIGLNI